jgi:N-acetylglutamate synthase-like GNAT family acetyltransferase
VKKENLNFRKACTDDADKIYKVLLKAFEPYKQKYTKEAFNATVISPEEIKERINQKNFDVLVAIYEDQIVGTASMSAKKDKTLYIRSMAVNPKFQKKGVGLFILDEIYRIAHRRDISLLSLDSSKPLKDAIRFYERYGFKRTGITHDFFGVEIFEMIKEL